MGEWRWPRMCPQCTVDNMYSNKLHDMSSWVIIRRTLKHMSCVGHLKHHACAVYMFYVFPLHLFCCILTDVSSFAFAVPANQMSAATVLLIFLCAGCENKFPLMDKGGFIFWSKCLSTQFLLHWTSQFLFITIYLFDLYLQCIVPLCKHSLQCIVFINDARLQIHSNI